MRRLIPSLLLPFASLVASFENQPDVIALTAADFKSVVDPESLILVEFYAPWCGHCKSLAPAYSTAATSLKEKKIKVAKVDCDAEADLCQEHGVRGYPTLKIFRKGEAKDYAGPREADGIVSYMLKQALPSVSILDSADSLTTLTNDNDVVVVVYAPLASDEFKAFSSVAELKRDDYVFAASEKADLASKAEVTAPAIVLYKKFDEGKSVFSGAFDEAAITAFVDAQAVPLVGEIGPENYSRYIESGLPLGYIFVSDDDQRKLLGDVFRPVAKTSRGKLNFVFIDANRFGAHSEVMDLESGKWPAFAIHEAEKNKKYPFDQTKELTADAVKAFVDSFHSGDLKAHFKSEPIPETNDDPVKVVVRDNFNEIVKDASKDVLIEFYATWCGHCKALAPIYEDLGKRYAGSDKIVIAKMEATKNDLPEDLPFQVTGFPTIKLFKAGSNEVVDYDGARDLDGFLAFLKTNAANDATPLEVAEEEKSEEEEVKDEL